MIDKKHLTFCDTFPLRAPNMVSVVNLLNPYIEPAARKWVTARAVWDTGATICAISLDLCNRLGLKPYCTEYVRSFSCPEGREAPYDRVMINLSKGPYVISTIAHVIDKTPDDYDMILGKIIMTSGSLNITVEGDIINFRLEIDPKYPFLKKLRTMPEFPEEAQDIQEI